MNRSTRTIVVVTIAVLVAGIASFGVYQAIRRMPVREIEVRSLYQVVAAHEMPMGTMITKDSVKLVAWPASSPVEKGFTTIDAVLNRGSGLYPIIDCKRANLEKEGVLKLVSFMIGPAKRCRARNQSCEQNDRRQSDIETRPE